MYLLRPQQPGQFDRMHGIMERSKSPVLPAITDVDSEPLPLGLLAGPHGLLPRQSNQWSLGHIEVSTLPLLIPSSSLYGCVDPLLLQCGPWSWPGQWHSCHILLAPITGMRWLDFSVSLYIEMGGNALFSFVLSFAVRSRTEFTKQFRCHQL